MDSSSRELYTKIFNIINMLKGIDSESDINRWWVNEWIRSLEIANMNIKKCCSLNDLKFKTSYFLYTNIKNHIFIIDELITEYLSKKQNILNYKIVNIHVISLEEEVCNWMKAPEVQHLVE